MLRLRIGRNWLNGLTTLPIALEEMQYDFEASRLTEADYFEIRRQLAEKMANIQAQMKALRSAGFEETVDEEIERGGAWLAAD